MKRLRVEKKIPIKVMMPPSLIQRVQLTARKKGISMNEFIRQSVEDKLAGCS